MGIRPLVLGRLKRRDQSGAEREITVIASEPTSFDLIGAELVRDVAPGEMIVVDDAGTRSLWPWQEKPRAMCLFEYVYFARPDAVLDGSSVYEVRSELGRRLAAEHPLAPSDIPTVVVPVPDSGVAAAIGYSEASGYSFQMGLIRSHYVGRTFIEPQDTIRHFGVRLKLHPNRAVLEGKRVIVVDDSIVRGTTSRKIIKMIRDAGAAEVHFRVSSPPTRWPCFYGIATPTRQELIASTQDEASITSYLEADSVGYLSLGALVASVRGLQRAPRVAIAAGQRPAADSARAETTSDVRTPDSGSLRGYCHACFSGEYPVPIPRTLKHRLRLVTG